jgi:hypothetical protein
MSDDRILELGELVMIERIINRTFIGILLRHIGTDVPTFSFADLLDEMSLMQEHMPTSEIGAGTEEGHRQAVGLKFWGDLTEMVEDAQKSVRERRNDLS